MAYQKKTDRQAEYIERYGMEMLGYQDEMKLWRNHPSMAQTRSAKHRLVDAFDRLSKGAQYYVRYCKSIPIEDSAEHAERVENFAKLIEQFETQFTQMIESAIYK